MNLSQLQVLGEVCAKPRITQAELCNRTGLSRGSISRITQQLVEEGLIKREWDTADSRQHYLLTTAKGRGAYTRHTANVYRRLPATEDIAT